MRTDQRHLSTINGGNTEQFNPGVSGQSRRGFFTSIILSLWGPGVMARTPLFCPVSVGGEHALSDDIGGTGFDSLTGRLYLARQALVRLMRGRWLKPSVPLSRLFIMLGRNDRAPSYDRAASVARSLSRKVNHASYTA